MLLYLAMLCRLISVLEFNTQSRNNFSFSISMAMWDESWEFLFFCLFVHPRQIRSEEIASVGFHGLLQQLLLTFWLDVFFSIAILESWQRVWDEKLVYVHSQIQNVTCKNPFVTVDYHECLSWILNPIFFLIIGNYRWY